MLRQTREQAVGALRDAIYRLPDSKTRLKDWLRAAAKGPFTDQAEVTVGEVTVSRDKFARLQWDIASSPPSVAFKAVDAVRDATTRAGRSAVTVADMTLPRTKEGLIAAVSKVLSLLPADGTSRSPPAASRSPPPA